MRRLKTPILLLLTALVSTSCFEDADDKTVSVSQINDFVWRGMNSRYLYKDDVPNLANDRFSTNGEYASYLDGFTNPETLFESLIYKSETVDRFSWIVDDYIALEAFFSGVSLSNGMEFQLYRFSSSDTNRFGVVTHILPNTDAASKGVKRGDIFYAINGTQLTGSNASQLLNQDNYTINLGVFDDNGTPDLEDDDFISPTSESITLSKTQYTENPVFIDNVLSVNNKKIAYLMYNGFTGTEQFNAKLNAVFGTFKSAGVNDLVLDLRYNPGGSVNTAILLSSMITGQFSGAVFSTEQWNSELQQVFENENPELLISRFTDNDDGTALHSLNLNKVYILTTKRSASASELVINSLRPYIQVVQIGFSTAGKYQASTTLYDSPNFRREGANPNHTYAMQPLIFKSLNVDGNTDYFEGLTPDIMLREKINNLGVLGDVNEPLLAAAISDISGTSKSSQQKLDDSDYFEITNSSTDFAPFQTGMYVDKKLPLN